MSRDSNGENLQGSHIISEIRLPKLLSKPSEVDLVPCSSLAFDTDNLSAASALDIKTIISVTSTVHCHPRT